MANVAVRLPSLLTSLLDLPRSIQVAGETLDEALGELCRRHPSLTVHLFDESGELREHVLCFVNETNSQEVDASRASLEEGDELTILQAVSGG